MNQYKIGDTVWTRKRGKCTVLHIYHTGILSTPDRPYLIISDSQLLYNPKAENLYPSEAAMNAARRNEVANKYLSGLPKITIDFSALEPYPSGWMTTDPIQPKFKVGDSVYLRGGKWTVRGRYWSGTEYRYNVSRPLTTDSDNLLAGITESDLRIWKETVLTHCLQIDGKTWYESDWEVLGYKSIKYLGNIVKHDTFLVESHGGNLNLFRGIKGDDI